MQKRLIAVLTRNPRLTSDLAMQLLGESQLVVGESLLEMRELLETHQPSAVLLDLARLPDREETKAQFLTETRGKFPGRLILVMGATPALFSEAEPANAMAFQNLPADTPAAEIHRLLKEHRELLESPTHPTHSPETARHVSLDDSKNFGAETVLSGITRRYETNSQELKAMLQDLEVAARHNVTILLIGETGSGKTFLSKLIHEVSPRRSEPFLHVACGALPNELIESELFGHVKGSFTSAHADKEGKFIAAGSGTILLDEIDVLGPEQQVKLLKVIETGEFEPVGSNQTFTSKARLVVASNLELQPLVEQGRFRPDLYYRLNMLKFEVPPLRSRKSDIMPLAKKFIGQLAAKHEIPIARIETHFFDALYKYPWPGNVRELENVIQRAVIYSREGVLGVAHLPKHILAGTAGPANDPSVHIHQQAPEDPDTLGRQIAFTEKEIIEQALFKNNFSRTHTAKDLGISRVTLYNKMKKYGMMKS